MILLTRLQCRYWGTLQLKKIKFIGKIFIDVVGVLSDNNLNIVSCSIGDKKFIMDLKDFEKDPMTLKLN